MQRLLLAALPVLVLDAQDFNAGVRAAQDEAIDDCVVGAWDNQQAITGPIRHLPSQAGVLLQVIDGALDGRDNSMGVGQVSACEVWTTGGVVLLLLYKIAKNTMLNSTKSRLQWTK